MGCRTRRWSRVLGVLVVALPAWVGWAQAQGVAPAVEQPGPEAAGQAVADLELDVPVREQLVRDSLARLGLAGAEVTVDGYASEGFEPVLMRWAFGFTYELGGRTGRGAHGNGPAQIGDLWCRRHLPLPDGPRELVTAADAVEASKLWLAALGFDPERRVLAWYTTHEVGGGRTWRVAWRQVLTSGLLGAGSVLVVVNDDGALLRVLSGGSLPPETVADEPVITEEQASAAALAATSEGEGTQPRFREPPRLLGVKRAIVVWRGDPRATDNQLASVYLVTLYGLAGPATARIDSVVVKPATWTVLVNDQTGEVVRSGPDSTQPAWYDGRPVED